MATPPEMMPGPSGPETLGDLYPADEDSYKELLGWCQNAFTAADAAREPYAERWRRYYKLYRSYMVRDRKDWRSTVFVPICFWIIETITPRLVAQLPKFTAYPREETDAEAAQYMEQLLDYAVSESELYVELVKAFKSSLKYGTGLLKTYHRTDIRRGRRMQKLMAPIYQTVQEPVIDPETGMPLADLDGQPLVEERQEEVGQVPMGYAPQKFTYVAYDGPAAECIDIFNFWVAPESQDMDSARYVIHRTFKELSEVKRRVAEGIYRWPDNMGPDDITSDDQDPTMERLSSIGLGSGTSNDTTRKPVELLEFWTDDGRVITMANRKAILRVQENPFDHSEKPFIRMVDYLAEHEFWGIGEIEPLEGLQDLHNALVNSRIDNVRLVLNSMFAVNVSNVEDLRDLRMRPGGVIRLKGDLLPKEVIERVDLGDVTSSAFSEAEVNERTIEKVSGVSAYQMGLDSPSLNNTATGVAIIQEQGASRFGLKSKLAELLGLRRLGRHYGSILQQFLTEERTIRLTGPQGEMLFQTFAPDSVQGALDYDIQSESTTQTQTMRLENKMNLLSLVASYAPQGVMAALDEVLDAMGIKDKARFMGPMPMPPMMPGQDPGMDPGMGGVPAPQGQPPGMGGPGMAMDPSMQAGAPMGMPPMGGMQGMSPEEAMALAGGNPSAGTPGDMSADRRLAELAAIYAQQATA